MRGTSLGKIHRLTLRSNVPALVPKDTSASVNLAKHLEDLSAKIGSIKPIVILKPTPPNPMSKLASAVYKKSNRNNEGVRGTIFSATA